MELPIACNIDAIPVGERSRYHALRRRVFEHLEAMSDTAEGYEFHLRDDGMQTLSAIGQWIALERLCCPFFRFAVHVDETGPIRLELSGRPGVKELLQVELAGGGLLPTSRLRQRQT